jgi:phospholipid/cholesterol/gamma-HCH transport system substrate-binding protein
VRRGQRQRITRVQAGLILLVVAVLATYFGFSKSVPFRQHFEIKAQFDNATNLRKGSFVRIAGVNVGEVVGIERLREGDAPVVATLRIDPAGRPIHKDATAKIRPNIFLEGNTFIDLRPGTPSQPTLGSGDTIPASQTSHSTQLDQILTSLQADTRANLQVLLQELSTALSGRGGIGYNKSIQYWEDAFRGSAVVNDATLGLQPHDLSNYLRHAGTVARALDANPEALKSLITDFNTTAAAFAREQSALEQTVAELPVTLRAAQPALRELNEAFPPVRRLAADFRPAVRSTGPMIDASMPFIRQARRLVAPRELRGLTADLRALVPNLARLNSNLPALYRQVRLASSCQNEVVLPWSHMTVPDEKFPATGQVFQEGVSGLPGLGAESRSGDANGQWARVLAANGTNVYAMGGVDTIFGQRFGTTNFPIEGVNPPPAPRPPSRYDVPCETQEPPDLRTNPGPAPQRLNTGQFSPQQQALNQANQIEGMADALRREGNVALANKWYANAHALRVDHDLVGKQWDIVGGRLTIVDSENAKQVTAGGAPLVPPFLLRGQDQGERARTQALALRGRGGGPITGQVEAGEESGR